MVTLKVPGNGEWVIEPSPGELIARVELELTDGTDAPGTAVLRVETTAMLQPWQAKAVGLVLPEDTYAPAPADPWETKP